VELTTRPRFPEVLLFTLILVAVVPWCGQETARPGANRVQVPVPATSLVAGSSPLSPGQRITLKAFAPGEKDFVTECFTEVEIRELDHEGTGTVLIALPAGRVFSLEQALANEKVRFTYNLGVSSADGGTDTCPPPTEPSPEPGKPSHATLELPSADLQFQASTPDKAQRLLLVVAMTRPTEGQPTAVLNPDTSTATACVKVTDFLDEQRGSTGTYDAQRTKIVRVQLPSEKITAIAARLAVPSRIWLLPDESCTRSKD